MDLKSLLEQVQARARDADVFDSVRISGPRLECRARGCESEAFFRVEPDDSDPAQVWISFVTPDRWLSESIEADLEHTGDELEELVEEELADLGVEAEVTYQHYRSEDRLFTFRTPVEVGGMGDMRVAAEVAAAFLLAYEAAFRELGDVAGSPEEM